MKDEKLKVLKSIYSYTDSKLAVFDEDVNLIWSNDKELFKGVMNESFYTPKVRILGIYGFNGIKGIKSEKEMLMKTKQSVQLVRVIPVFEENMPEGYVVETVNILSQMSRFMTSYSSIGMHKYLSLVREISSEIVFSSDALKNDLELVEQYDLANRAETLTNSTYKALSSVANLEELVNYTVKNFRTHIGSLSEQVEDIVLAVIPKLKQEGVDVKYSIKSGINAELDFSRFSIAMLNLISNAITYNKSEKKELFVKLSKIGEKAVLSVTDNGNGIDSDTEKLLFVPFATSDIAKNNEGLGLTIVKLFCDEFSSSFSYTTKVGEGTTATLTIPTSRSSLTLKAPMTGHLFEKYSPVEIYLYKSKV